MKNKALDKDERAAEAARLVADLEARHARELAELRAREASTSDAAPPPGVAAAAAPAREPEPSPAAAEASSEASEPRKPSRTQIRNAKRLEEQLAREREVSEARAQVEAAGGTAKDREVRAIESQLHPLGLCLRHVQADGNCLFRALHDQAVVAGCAVGPAASHISLRRAAADFIADHAAEYGPFLPFDASADGDPEEDLAAAVRRYCSRLATTAMWGGHPELRALASVLSRTILVYRAGQATAPLAIRPDGEATPDADDISADSRSNSTSTSSSMMTTMDGHGHSPLRVSFHEHYYALGEHYNSVVPIIGGATEPPL